MVSIAVSKTEGPGSSPGTPATFLKGNVALSLVINVAVSSVIGSHYNLCSAIRGIRRKGFP